MSIPWQFKFNCDQICTVEKQTGEVVRVRVEGVQNRRHLECPMYDVREVNSGIGYPALESSLRAEARKR